MPLTDITVEELGKDVRFLAENQGYPAWQQRLRV